MTTETTVATLKKKKKKPSDSPQNEPRLHQPFKLVFVKAKSLLVPSLAAAVGYTVAPGEPAIDHIPASRGSRCRIARQDAAGRVRGGGEGNKTRSRRPHLERGAPRFLLSATQKQTGKMGKESEASTAAFREIICSRRLLGGGGGRRGG